MGLLLGERLLAASGRKAWDGEEPLDLGFGLSRPRRAGAAPHSMSRCMMITRGEPRKTRSIRANARTMVIALVETAKGIENVDAIAAVDGVDVVSLGHYDLTNFLDIPGQFYNPIFHAAVDSLTKACKKHGKTPGFLAGDEKWARDFRARGFRMIAYGVDTLLMQSALAVGIKLLRETVTD
jgi:2-keto-3-deoxy-L-rhamnonate aldolase RhmA